MQQQLGVLRTYGDRGGRRPVPHRWVLGGRRSRHLFPVLCFPSRGVSWGGVRRYKMFIILKLVG
jgi:hypothetical protein